MADTPPTSRPRPAAPLGPGAAFHTAEDAPWHPDEPRRFVAWLFGALLLGLLVIGGFNWYVDATGVTGRDTKWRIAENAKDRTVKLDLYESMRDDPPQTVLLGSSRVMKFQPSVVERLTGARTFNAAVSGGTPEDVLLFTELIAQRQGRAFPHLVWGIDVDAFRDKQLKDGLANDPRVQQFLPASTRVTNAIAMVGALLELQTLKASIRSVRAGGTQSSGAPKRTYGRDGYQQWELHRPENAYQLRQQVAKEIRQYADFIFVRDGYDGIRPDPLAKFREVIRIANEHGDTPTVFVTPYQPQAHRILQEHDIDARTREVLALLRRLQREGELKFQLDDFTSLDSFGGDPAEFYDGVHMTTVNTARVLEQLQRDGKLAAPK